jgi:hypothetical protein
MNRYALLAAGAFAALFLAATSASAACPDSPKVTGAKPKDKARLLAACQADGQKMHNLCDNVPKCVAADSKAVVQTKIAANQKCVNARRKISTDWYGGSDSGHDGAVTGKVNALDNCLVALGKAH